MLGFRPYRRRPAPLPGSYPTYRAALADAQQEIPYGHEPSPWVGEVHRACAGWAERLAADWCQADRLLLARWLTLAEAVQSAAGELDRARQEEERLEAEQAAASHLHPDQQNPMAHSLSTPGYLLAMLLLTTLELPLVYMSFTAFGLPPVYTALLSLLSAGIAAFLGHALGTISRHLRLRPRPMLAVLLVLAGCFTGSLAWLREGALEVVRSETATLDPAMAALALFAISLASLAVAALLAWHHGGGPVDRRLRGAARARRRCERQVERLRRALGRVESARRAAQAMARQEVRVVGEAMLGRFHRYARWNQLHRDKHDLPPSLHDANLPRLPTPALLEQPLTWAVQEPHP